MVVCLITVGRAEVCWVNMGREITERIVAAEILALNTLLLPGREVLQGADKKKGDEVPAKDDPRRKIVAPPVPEEKRKGKVDTVAEVHAAETALKRERALASRQGVRPSRHTPMRDPFAEYRPFLVPEPLDAFPRTKVARYSHYNEPVAQGPLHGRSRKWGDAAPDVQAKMVSLLVSEFKKEHFTREEIAIGLAVVRHESGFNPDAAAKPTSAAGLGQLIDRTRETLAKQAGISGADPFDAAVQSRLTALVLREAFNFAEHRGAKQREVWKGSDATPAAVYGYHHDGPSLRYGGLELGYERIAPWVPLIDKALHPASDAAHHTKKAMQRRAHRHSE